MSNATLREALERILEAPKNTMSDSKALKDIVRMAKAALAADDAAQRKASPADRWLAEARSNIKQALAADDAARGTMREQFEAWADATQPGYWRTTAWAREVWVHWSAAWQASRAAAPQAEPQGVDPMQDQKRPSYFIGGAADEHPAEQVLRKLASWLGVGGYNAPTVDAEMFHDKIVSGIEYAIQSAAKVAAPQSVEPVARLLHWHGPAHMPVPHGGIAARTYAEFPANEAGPVNPQAYWHNGAPLYLAPPSAPTDAEWQEEAMRLIENYGTACQHAHVSKNIEAAADRIVDTKRALRAHIATRPDEWRPIEECPQDGYFLVHEDGAIRALLRIKGVWHKPGYPALVTTSYWADVLVGDDAKRLLEPLGYKLDLRDGCCENPTEWRTLPAPPTKKGAGA